MRISPEPDVLVAHLAGEAVLLNLRDKNYYRLNETAAFIWQAIEAGESREAIVELVTNHFEVDATTATLEIDNLLVQLQSRGLINE